MNRYALRGGRKLVTLQQAADYVMELPEDVQHERTGRSRSRT